MLKGRIVGTPIVYESQKAEKTIVDITDDQKNVECQLNGYNSKVGFATNISSSIYTMLEEFPMGSDEQEALLKRLKIGRAIQGEIIDGVKGLNVPPFREHWTKYKKITKDMSPVEAYHWDFNNKILCNVRPAYFRFLYPHYMTKYNKEIKKYNIYSHLRFKKSFIEILKSNNQTIEQEIMTKEYNLHSFFLENNAIVNRISRYMRTNIALIGKYTSKATKNFDYTILQNPEYSLNPELIEKMTFYLQEYKTFKKGLRNTTNNFFSNLDTFTHYLRKECEKNISNNESELANYGVEITYGKDTGAVEFVWKLFGEGILENIMLNSPGILHMPIQDDYGEIEYLFSKYSIKEYRLENLYKKIQ